ncbi:hypothetical protein EVG20_g9591 [Dentipellis fragilis]|uniref:Uncharacterized protein n=1 Tax=Dentipellis fragilis TaxID=205917 RepID=A0A4Y9Y021_9AGAM|nr:hypothetical protein EVG20_g9591 [Dentipellis fragilis]
MDPPRNTPERSAVARKPGNPVARTLRKATRRANANAEQDVRLTTPRAHRETMRMESMQGLPVLIDISLSPNTIINHVSKSAGQGGPARITAHQEPERQQAARPDIDRAVKSTEIPKYMPGRAESSAGASSTSRNRGVSIPQPRLGQRKNEPTFVSTDPEGKTYFGPNLSLFRRNHNDHLEDDQPQRFSGFATGGGKEYGRAARKVKDTSHQVAVKAAKKRKQGTRLLLILRTYVDSGEVIQTDESDESSSREDSTSDESEVAGPKRPHSPSAQLLFALEALTLHKTIMEKTKQLPYLPRNLHKGFLLRCSREGINTQRTGSAGEVRVITERETGGLEDDKYETTMNDWLCPLCGPSPGPYPTRDALNAHLRWDHEEVGVGWNSFDDAWELRLLLRDPVIELTDSEDEDETSSEDEVGPREPPSPVRTEDDIMAVEIEAMRDITIREESPIPEMPEPPHAVAHISFKFEAKVDEDDEPHPSELHPHRPFIDDEPRPGGPAARYPYLPIVHGNTNLLYSCKPVTGPRLLDFVDTLEIENHGVAGKWLIWEREDEIFELDDVRDEDKVMCAVWNRWIALHRKKFITNYIKGVEDFVKDNLWIIYQAVGRDGLKVWLLLLIQNRFLNGHGMASVMQLYDELVRCWCAGSPKAMYLSEDEMPIASDPNKHKQTTGLHEKSAVRTSQHTLRLQASSLLSAESKLII